MARRADHTREELAELALAAGRELIKKEGFSHFSVRKAAANIGYTVGTLYNVFGGYDDFILRINALTLDEWFAVMEKALAAGKDANPLRTLAKAYIDYSRTHYNEWLALFEHHAPEDHPIPEWYLAKLKRFFTPVEKLLLPMAGGNRRKAKRAAHVLWAGIHGICVLSLSGKLGLVDADSAEVLALSFIDNFMAGLTAGH